MNCNTTHYRANSSSVPGDPTATRAADPDQELFGWWPRRRLTAEELRDSMLAVSGKLDPRAGGPSDRDGKSLRRTIYVFGARAEARSFRMLFDAPDPFQPAERRVDSIVAPQALYLLNNDGVLDRSDALARRVLALPGDDATRVASLYALLYGRPATPDEIALGVKAVVAWSANRPGGSDADPVQTAWRTYCQALLCANEFAYVD